MFQADSLEITVLVENWADALLPDLHDGVDGDDGDHCVTRHGLIELFDPARPLQPQAEMGLSLLVRARSGRRELTVLFDAGLTGTVLLNNLAALRQNPEDVSSIVISHGHPDHFGGVHAFLGALDTPRPLITHEDAFLPRTAILGDGAAATHYNAAFTQDSLARAGATTMLTTEPVELGAGVVTTGIIPRITDFEGPRPPARRGAPGLYQLGPDGDFRLDEVWDEQGLVIDVRGHGLVVLTGCAHAGVVNTVLRARQLFPDRPIRAVIGGFHLGFPTTPAENVAKTVTELRELEVRTIVPMHCSGLRAHAAFSTELPEQYRQPAVGTVLRFA